ncbi:hypothetical protein K439DRAFT_1085250 [Ramaria rubella]|nr:hypothetical protein K439DRAFT_1085250 [Ramaria rubella]
MYILNPAEDFKLLKGERSDMITYKFNRKVISHMACPTCASGIFIDYNLGPVKLVGVNTHSIGDLDVQKLTLKLVDGHAS